MKKRSLIFLFILSALPGFAEAEFGGTLTATAAASQWDNPEWRTQRLRFRPEILMSSGSLEFKGSGEIMLDPLNEELNWDLRELYVDVDSLAGRWTVGRQNISWGQSLALPVLDVVCPTDYSVLFNGEGENDTQPVTAIRWQYDFGSVMAEALYIAEYRPAILPVDPRNELPAGTVFREASYPADSPLEGEWGARCRFFLPFGDIGAVVFYGWEDRSLYPADIDMSGGTPVLTVKEDIPRFLLAGINGAFPVGAVLLRLETGLIFNRSFAVEGIGEDPIVSHQWLGMAGVDWFPSDWRIAAEVFCSARLSEGENAVDDRIVLNAAAEVSYGFGSGRWEASCKGLYDVYGQGWYLNPQLSHFPADGLEIAMGAEIPWGDEGLFEAYEQEVTGYLRCSYSF